MTNSKYPICPTDQSRHIPLEAMSDGEVPLYIQTLNNNGFPDASDSQVCVTEEGEYKFGPVGLYVKPGEDPKASLKEVLKNIQTSQVELGGLCRDYSNELAAQEQSSSDGASQAPLGFFHGVVAFGVVVPGVDALARRVLKSRIEMQYFKERVHYQMAVQAEELGLLCEGSKIPPELEPFRRDLLISDILYFASLLGVPAVVWGLMKLWDGTGSERLSEDDKKMIQECFNITIPDKGSMSDADYKIAILDVQAKLAQKITEVGQSLNKVRAENVRHNILTTNKRPGYWEQHGFTIGSLLGLGFAFSQHLGAHRLSRASGHMLSSRRMRYTGRIDEARMRKLDELARLDAERRLAELVNARTLLVCEQGENTQAKQAAAEAWAKNVLASYKQQPVAEPATTEAPQPEEQKIRTQPATKGYEVQSLFPDFKQIAEDQGYNAAQEAYMATLIDLEFTSQLVQDIEARNEIKSHIATLNHLWATFKQEHLRGLSNPPVQGPQLTSPNSPVKNPSRWAECATKAMVEEEASRFLKLAHPTPWANNPFAEQEALEILKNRIIYLSQELKNHFVHTLIRKLDLTSSVKQEYYLNQSHTRAWNKREPTHVFEAIIAARIRTRDIQIAALDLVPMIVGPQKINMQFFLNENVPPIQLMSDRELYTQLVGAAIMVLMTRSAMGGATGAVVAEEAVLAEEVGAASLVPGPHQLVPPRVMVEIVRRVVGM